MDSQKTFAGSKNSITSINLSKTNLTDDGLKSLAESGIFAQVSELIMRDNPLISGQGLAYIGDSVKNLRALDIGFNPQLFKEKEVAKWIQKAGFKTLEGFRVYHTEMTTKIFERLLDETSWFKQLAGLDIRYNPELCISSRIGELSNLSEFRQGRHHITRYFDNKGLYCKGCVIPPLATELMLLGKQGKANLVANAMPLWETSFTEEERLRLVDGNSNE